VLAAQFVSDDFFGVTHVPQEVGTGAGGYGALPKHANELTGKLRPGDRVKDADVDLRILAEVYLETDELA
jgi:hypothetical protein